MFRVCLMKCGGHVPKVCMNGDLSCVISVLNVSREEILRYEGRYV